MPRPMPPTKAIGMLDIRPMTAAVIARSNSSGPKLSPLVNPCVGAVRIAVNADSAPANWIAGAITFVLTALLTPVIALNFLPEGIADWVEKYCLMGAGLAIQQTVERDDNIGLGPAGGLAVVTAYAVVALVVAFVAVGRRDA